MGLEWGKFRNRCVLRTVQLAKEPCLLFLSLSLFLLLSFPGYRVLVTLIAVSISLGFSSAGGRQGADVKCMCVVESAAEKARCFELRAFRLSMLAVAGSKSTLQC